MSRPYTIEEMRRMFVDHLEALARYWASTDLSKPEFRRYIEGKGEILYRLEGLLHSILVTFDGASGDMPAFDIVPSDSTENRKYHQARGENWWPEDTVINDCQLHDLLSK